MPAGRPRQPDNVKKLRGTWRRDRDGGQGVEPAADGEPIPPRHLKGEALRFWMLIVPDLAQSGIAKARDSAMLAMACEWWARYRRFSKLADRLPDSSKNIYRVTVQVGICWTNCDRILARFGLTPSDRAKMRIEEKPQPDELD